MNKKIKMVMIAFIISGITLLIISLPIYSVIDNKIIFRILSSETGEEVYRIQQNGDVFINNEYSDNCIDLLNSKTPYYPNNGSIKTGICLQMYAMPEPIILGETNFDHVDYSELDPMRYLVQPPIRKEQIFFVSGDIKKEILSVNNNGDIVLDGKVIGNYQDVIDKYIKENRTEEIKENIKESLK